MCKHIGASWACSCTWTSWSCCKDSWTPYHKEKQCPHWIRNSELRLTLSSPKGFLKGDFDEILEIPACCSPDCCQNDLNWLGQKPECSKEYNRQRKQRYEKAVAHHFIDCIPLFNEGIFKTTAMRQDMGEFPCGADAIQVDPACRPFVERGNNHKLRETLPNESEYAIHKDLMKQGKGPGRAPPLNTPMEQYNMMKQNAHRIMAQHEPPYPGFPYPGPEPSKPTSVYADHIRPAAAADYAATDHGALPTDHFFPGPTLAPSHTLDPQSLMYGYQPIVPRQDAFQGPLTHDSTAFSSQQPQWQQAQQPAYRSIQAKLQNLAEANIQIQDLSGNPGTSVEIDIEFCRRQALLQLRRNEVNAVYNDYQRSSLEDFYKDLLEQYYAEAMRVIEEKDISACNWYTTLLPQLQGPSIKTLKAVHTSMGGIIESAGAFGFAAQQVDAIRGLWNTIVVAIRFLDPLLTTAHESQPGELLNRSSYGKSLLEQISDVKSRIFSMGVDLDPSMTADRYNELELLATVASSAVENSRRTAHDWYRDQSRGRREEVQAADASKERAPDRSSSIGSTGSIRSMTSSLKAMSFSESEYSDEILLS